MKRTIGFLLAAALAVTGLTACMGDDNSSARGERRAAALVSAGAQSAAKMQLTIDGITPTGQAIEVLSYSWGVEASGGVAQFADLHITKTMDETSPLLFDNLARGRIIARAELKLYTDPGGRGLINYATFMLEQVLVKSVQNAGSAQAEALPTEEVSLAYARIREETRLPLDANGNQGPRVVFGWDIAARRIW